MAATYRLRGPHAQPELAKRMMLHLPVAHSLKEVASLGVLYVLSRIGLLKEPERRSDGSDGHDARMREMVHLERTE